MISGKTAAMTRPTALGSLLQAATYGLAIPTVYGTTQTSLLAFWAANLRQGSCHGKKGKGKKKKGPPTYVENIDFLIGSNPIEGVLQIWENGNKYPLNFTSVRSNASFNPLGSITVSDPYFYAVVAVTWEYRLTGSFQDYGSSGPPAPYDVTAEFPLWNAVQHGPDLLDAGASRNYPWVYKWAFGDRGVVTFPFAPVQAPEPWQSAFTGWTTIYYAQLSTAIGLETPLVKACLTFEPTAGDGPEYNGNFDGTSTPLATQRILYPPYAGAGSPNIDLGSTGAIPLIKPEVMGSFKRWHPRGDADFADMIEDTIKSGMLQTGAELGLIQRGVNLNTLPGPVQTGYLTFNFPNPDTPLTYYQPNKQGNQLLAICSYPNSSPSVSDAAGDTWLPILDANGQGVFTAVSVGAAAGNRVDFNNATGGIRAAMILELDQGSTVLDNYRVFSGAASSAIRGSILTTGEPTLVLAILFAGSGPAKVPTHWTDVFASINKGSLPGLCVFSRIVSTPGLCTFKSPASPGSAWTLVLLAYNAAEPVPYPKALGDIIDGPSLLNARQQCWAAGLMGSVNMNSQKPASDWLKEFYECMNAWPVWSGDKLKSIARSEVSAVGNGQVYIAPTAAGPVATLTEDDLIGDTSKPLIVVKRKAQVDSYNIKQMQFFDRNADYNPSVASEPLNGAIALRGPRKEDPTDMPEIQDPAVARMLLSIEVNRYNELRNGYSFTMQGKWFGLEAGDLILINDSKIGITNLPVRLTSVQENDQFELETEAEPFVYGCNSPQGISGQALPVTTLAPFSPGDGGDPGSVNAPIIFEPVPRLTAQQNQAQVWLVVSGSSPNYGGCSVLISTDGGSSYTAIGVIQGNADTGVTVNDWPAANDPDTADDLQVDLTESLGELDTYSAADRDNFVPLFYVVGGTTCVPYEIGAYDIATLTAAYKYTLPATGGGTNELRRGVFGAPGPTVGVGMDHPSGSRFAFLNPLGFGMLKLNMDPSWIGKTLYFKFLAVNQRGNNLQDQSSATAYSYTPNGCPAQTQNPNSNDYVNAPAVSLSQTTATNVAMAQTSVQFPSNKVNYNARNFAIPDPGGTPTVYYVTIYDPSQLGDTGSGTTCPSYCETSNAKVGQPGYTYMGFIQATHSITDPLNVAGPGGWPPPQGFLVAP